MSEEQIHTNTGDAGSYAFGQFDENQKELDRLKFQAGTARQLEKHILQKAGLKSGMRVLDLACGPGIISCELARLAAPGQVTGLDLSPDLLVEARKAAQSEGIDNLSFQQGNVYELDLPDNEYDFVYARFLFQHLEQPEVALAEVRRVLKPGGTVAILDIDDDWLTVHPEPGTFDAFTERAARAQNARGGDRHIGRRLGGLLAAADYAQADVFVETVTSGQIGMREFLDITTGFKLEQLLEEEKAQGLEEQKVIYQLVDDPSAWGFAAVFVATGVKPE